MRRGIGWTLLAALAVASPITAQGISNVSISGDEVSASISLAGGISADLTIEFEDVSGLSASSLGLSAHLSSPTALLGRLPSNVALLSAFPVVLRIEPPQGGGLEFSGVATVSLHTSNLDYVSGTTLRLFKAPLNGTFTDVTEWMGSGSYRVRGSTGGFSEFVIVADARSLADVIDEKYDALEGILDDASGTLPAALYAELSGLLASSRDAYDANEIDDAIDDLDEFSDRVVEESGSDIPDTWRAARDLDNVAGSLRAAAATLRFSLGL